MGALAIVPKELGIVGRDLESYGRTRDCMDGLGNVRTDSGLYGRTWGRTNGFVIVDRIGISQTDSESYGRTQDCTDGRNIKQ